MEREWLAFQIRRFGVSYEIENCDGFNEGEKGEGQLVMLVQYGVVRMSFLFGSDKNQDHQ